jgi:hypothetical protein
MDTVVEVNEFGQVVHLVPHDGLVLLVAIADRLEQGAIGPDLGVACHTDLSGRDARMGRLRNGPVAIAAIDAQLLGVVFVAEGTGWSGGSPARVHQGERVMLEPPNISAINANNPPPIVARATVLWYRLNTCAIALTSPQKATL